MNTILITVFDDAMKDIGVLTSPRMAKYAGLRGWDFHAYRWAYDGSPDAIYWTKIVRAFDCLDRFDRVIYLDADQMVTNFDYELPEMPDGFCASRDWGHDATERWHFSMCGFSVTSGDMLVRALELKPKFDRQPFPEQEPMRQLMMAGYRDMHSLPRKIFNCVPDDVCPGRVVEPWYPGDWCAHLTMMTTPQRVELFHKLKARLNE